MASRPASAVSLFTGIGVTIIMGIGIWVLLAHHVAWGYLALWCVVLLAVIGFNVWAGLGSRGH